MSQSNKRSLNENNLALTESKRRKLGSEARDGGPRRTDFTVEDYTVGWVCALHIEMAAVKCMLDDIHDTLKKNPNDSNTYILGSLHHHNTVIACLPADGYGTNNAAVVASNMRLVGIGGGAPGKVDIRLGDVAVSTRVIQYDLGKTIQQGRFVPVDITRQPLSTLRTAVSTLRAHHESELSKIPIILSQIRERYSAITHVYEHTESDTSCDNCDKSKLVCRPSRETNHPVIYYGTIASGNQVIKHGKKRDQLAQDLDVICFEMEAAGLMDSLQCLVIRGIYNYSDSYKRKDVELVQDRRKSIMTSLLFEKINAWYSNIKSAYGKTCAWLLSHPDYIGWLTPADFVQHYGLLWIYGKPGAGKLTLMKYIYTRVSENTDTTISFFFNARGDDLEKSTEGMYLLDSTNHLGQVYTDDGSWDIDGLQCFFSAAIFRDMVDYFEELGNFARDAEGKLYICFLSRHYSTICIQHGQTLILEDQTGHGQDLEKYVRKKLQAGRGKDVESVRTTLLEKAAGVFMWVVLVRDSKNMADLLFCIQWVLYAKRPLKLEEFYYAVVAGLDPAPENIREWDPQQITKDMNRFVSSLSKGLAEVTKSKAGCYTGTVQFIHESVRDFLLKDGVPMRQKPYDNNC
ncbi:nucleoside phosphorylase domain-containing protein [Astrocystis sublimbata]|nr:nucleoside phosphorylase domain-containing protein [Astrocystis sublimbata]